MLGKINKENVKTFLWKLRKFMNVYYNYASIRTQ